MKLAYAILADAAQITADNKIMMLGGEMDTVFAPAVPTFVPRVTIVVKLLMETADLTSQHSVRVDVRNEQGITIVPGGDMRFGPLPPESISAEKTNILVAINMPPLVFQDYGTYSVDLWVDGELLAAMPLRVSRPPTAP